MSTEAPNSPEQRPQAITVMEPALMNTGVNRVERYYLLNSDETRLQLWNDGVVKGEVPGKLTMKHQKSVPFSGKHTRLIVEVEPEDANATPRIEELKRQYNTAVTNWENDHFPHYRDIEEFREKYLTPQPKR